MSRPVNPTDQKQTPEAVPVNPFGPPKGPLREYQSLEEDKKPEQGQLRAQKEDRTQPPLEQDDDDVIVLDEDDDEEDVKVSP